MTVRLAAAFSLLSTWLATAALAAACTPSPPPPRESPEPRASSTGPAAPLPTAAVASIQQSPPAPPAAASPPSRTPPPVPTWPLPRTCDVSDCRLASGEPGVRCAPDGVCANPCRAGMGPERGGSFCSKLCRTRADCGGDPCSPEGVCNRWPDNRDCSGEFCTLPAGRGTGFRCGGTCVQSCKKGLVLYGGTHCAKPCKRATDCPGGDCSEGICGPLCPSEGCPYRWE